MAVTSLGLIGSATGSGLTLDIPVTVDVPACDVTTWREIIVYGFAASMVEAAVEVVSAADDGVPTDPNVCWGPNPYGGGTYLGIDNGSATTPSGLEEFLGVQYFSAPAYQPLFNGLSTITITYADTVYWCGALAIAIEGSTDGREVVGAGNADFDHPADGPGTPTPYALSRSLTTDGSTTFGIFTMFQHYTTGVAALAFEEGGATVEGSIYDSGAGHVSLILGTMALTPSTSYGSGGSTDIGVGDNPYGAVFPTIVPFGGLVALYGDGVGLDPCPTDQLFGVAATVGDYAP